MTPIIMNTNTYGSVWSKETIDSEPLPTVSRELLPWLIKDRREAVEGVWGKDSNGKPAHDGSGLDKAKRSLRAAETGLSEGPTDAKVLRFLTEQVSTARGKVAFYEGKIYLLDKVIASLS